jgi:uncharacterized protein YprB with RNaseH-like and TPR domain
MLRHTFCHLPGVGEKTEQRLWAAGLTTWEIVLDQEPDRVTAARRLPASFLRESVAHHAGRNAAWFAERLTAGQSWRLFGDFRDSCAYLDIETTGMGDGDYITTIALYDGRSIRTYIHGQNLDDFVRDVQPYRLLVTYNGKSFDLPFLRRCLRCDFRQAHIDLRHTLASLDLRGGLKNCERLVGLRRPGMEEIDGFVAVLLWRDFRRRKDPRALETLLAYNIQDAVNLETLMVHAHNRKLAGLTSAPFAAGYHLPPPPVPVNPFRADPDTVRRVLRDNPWFVPGGFASRLSASSFPPRPSGGGCS